MTVGQIIKDARKRAGLSLKDLSARILKEDGTPISIPYLNDIERDRRNPPSPALLRQFAAVLGVSFEHLLYLTGELPEDVRGGSYSTARIEAAYEAFRRTLQEHGDTSADTSLEPADTSRD
jgi:transcriptional regulator with XRE-family HTH domain